MRRGADYILRLKPWSVSAFAVALLAVVLAAFLQGVLASPLGSSLHFVGFYPAILVVSLFAGIPAGAFAATLVIPGTSNISDLSDFCSPLWGIRSDSIP
jgi:hypothetical protein